MAAKEIHYGDNTFMIAYTMIDNNATQDMIFLHGWGSNKELMALSFSPHFRQHNHIYIDLPGFGASPNDMFLTTQDYANIIALFLEAFQTNAKKPPIIVGHSFGGKIALLLPYEIILLSSAGILLPKSFQVRCKIALAKLAKKLPFQLNFLKAADAQGLNPAMYAVFKHVVQEDFAPHYRDFQHRATIFWGRNDTATPMAAYNTICTLMPHAKGHVLEGDHYFFMNQGALIEQLYYA